MPIFICLLSGSRSTSRGGKHHSQWLLSLFVGLLCTNMAKPAAAQANGTSLTPVHSITKSMIDQEVAVQAVISSVREPSAARAPYIVSLTEGGATLPLVYWPDMQPQLAAKVKVGNPVRVTATVSVYHDQLQLRLRNADALAVVGGTAAAADAPTAVGPADRAPKGRVSATNGIAAAGNSITKDPGYAMITFRHRLARQESKVVVPKPLGLSAMYTGPR